LPKNDEWSDFVCVWERVDEKQTDIVVSNDVVQNIGILEKTLNNNNYPTKKMLKILV
jgi:predicted TPR repeat methyltransferase